QYTWLRQPRANGQYGYLVGRDNGQAWGTFKEGSATASKPAETKPANKPAQPTNKQSTNNNVNNDWNKQYGIIISTNIYYLITFEDNIIFIYNKNNISMHSSYHTETQYTWLRQTRANGKYGYLVGRDNGQAWGTFKEGSATTAKPNTNTNKPAEKPSTNTNVN